jgi:hypothetical protein
MSEKEKSFLFTASIALAVIVFLTAVEWWIYQ